MAREPQAAVEVQRSQCLVDRLPDLLFGLPVSVGAAVEYAGVVAIPTRRITGSPHPPGSGDPTALRDLLDQIHAIDPGPLTPHLATPRVVYGGPRWLDVLTTEVVPRLPSAARDEARCRIDALAALPSSRRVVNHGDLAGSNILWDCGRVVGVIDWDLTSHDDPAEDVASLATWHGWHLVGELADADTVTRAEAFRGCFPLQVIAFAILRERPADEIAHTIERALERLGKAPC